MASLFNNPVGGGTQTGLFGTPGATGG